jgi:uncharacterized protein (TIRG00374 family)
VVQKLRSIGILALTAFLLILVIRRVGLTDLLSTVSGAEPLWIGLSICLAPMLIFTGVIKWKILLTSQGIEVPLRRLYGLYLVARFFNNFLPSTVGGDVVRGYELGNYTKNGAAAMASVFMERFTGLVVLVIMAVIAFVSQINVIQDYRLTLAMGFAVVALLGILWLILDPRPMAIVEKFATFSFTKKIIPKVKKFHASLLDYRNQRRALVLTLLWSVIFMTLAIINVYASARAFHQPIPFWGVVVIVPIILVAAMVPLTFNGLGIQEWAYVLLFTLIGLPASVGLSTILLIRLKDYLMALIGGLIYPYLKLAQESRVNQVETSES